MTSHLFCALFDQPEAWQVFASGQAEGRLSRVAGGRPGLRLDYDFHGGGGFVVIRRELRFRLPETFEIGFELRGEGPRNHFEFKVADLGGANVWRYLQADYPLPEAWTGCRFHERDLPFAWGPAGGGAPSEVAAVEFVIAAGPGGTGWLELSAPSFADQTFRQPQSVRATSHAPGFSPEEVFSAAPKAGWRAADDDADPRWEVDFGRSVRFGGLVIGWPEELPPRGFEVEISADETSWTRVHRAAAALGTTGHIPVPGAAARYLRISFANAACAALGSLELRPDAFSRTPNEFIHSVAGDFPRGWFPRYWHREQSYWTPVGSPAGKRRALINEEGLVETDEAGFSLEPFVLTADGLLTWAEVATSLELAKGGAPLPCVTWKAAGLRLAIMPWVAGSGRNLTLHVSYRLQGASPGTRLVVAVRPFQVNPPWQAFRNLGGRSPIHEIVRTPEFLTVEHRQVTATPAPDQAGAAAFEEGGVTAFLAAGTVPPRDRVRDDSGLASAAMSWELPAGQTSLAVTVSVPYFAEARTPAKAGWANALARWRQTLAGVQWQVPACAAPAFDCFRTAAGHILINRDGPAIQPGPRRYTRSWVRDCVIMGAALAKAGLPAALREFLTWYAQFQREDGFVPCVVDRDGVDWLVEHDSHGQFIWGLREVFREGGDRGFLAAMLPHARRAADYLIALRAQRMTPEYQLSRSDPAYGLLPESVSMEDEDTVGERAACYGLLPESASHEGYLAHPVHSYWDDFWGVRGLEAAAELAEAAGCAGDATRWRAEAAAFQEDLLHSLERVIAAKQLNYIPGSVEWADFDPTATSNAIGMLDFADLLPAAPLAGMLDTYLDGFRRKHRGEMQWNNYTAYEIRIIGALVRLGKRAEANELLEFFLSDRRPLEWNQWPEITWRDPRSPGHLGDVPHTWIAAEYLLALASMVASEREATAAMVLAAGLPWAWIAAAGGFAVTGLPTRFGLLDFAIQANGTEAIEVKVGGALALPPGGLSIAPPLPPGKRIIAVTVCSGQAPGAGVGGEAVRVPMLPFAATLVLGPAAPQSC
jgi:hypothetical protein